MNNCRIEIELNGCRNRSRGPSVVESDCWMYVRTRWGSGWDSLLRARLLSSRVGRQLLWSKWSLRRESWLRVQEFADAAVFASLLPVARSRPARGGIRWRCNLRFAALGRTVAACTWPSSWSFKIVGLLILHFCTAVPIFSLWLFRVPSHRLYIRCGDALYFFLQDGPG